MRTQPLCPVSALKPLSLELISIYYLTFFYHFSQYLVQHDLSPLVRLGFPEILKHFGTQDPSPRHSKVRRGLLWRWFFYDLFYLPEARRDLLRPNHPIRRDLFFRHAAERNHRLLRCFERLGELARAWGFRSYDIVWIRHKACLLPNEFSF